LKLHVLLAEIAPPPAPAAAEPRDEKAEQRAPEAGSEVERRIAALKHQRRLHVVAEPLITVLDNQAAFFQVGRREPRVTGQTATPRGQVRQFSMEDVGTVLGVTPRIRDDGSVAMEMDVEASYLGPEAEGAVIAEGPDGAEIRTPPVQTIKLQTTVTARDGEAVVAGRFFADTAAGPRELLLVVKPEVTKPAP
jgi:type II secretory pathway component GspD/PulD (secretin)